MNDLSSDETDEWLPPGDENHVAEQHDDKMDILADSPHNEDMNIDLSDVLPEKVAHASTAKNQAKHKIVYKFDKKRAFVPPSNLEFIDAQLEPKPKDDTPYNYFKYFVTSDMFEYLAEESNHYAHQKVEISLQTSACELETFVGLFFTWD